MLITEAVLEDGMSEKGGWTENQLAILGVQWPPKRGWKKKVLGKEMSRRRIEAFWNDTPIRELAHLKTVKAARMAERKKNRKKAKRAKKLEPRQGQNQTAIDNFYASFEWRRARYEVLRKNNGRCELCGKSKHDGIILHIDHIKPLRFNWSLRLSQSNLQVLCEICNHGKGNTYEDDWRGPRLATVMGERIDECV